MTDNKNLTTDTLGTLSLIGRVLGFLDKLVMAFFFMAQEYLRIKAKKSEDRVKELETTLRIEEKKDEIEKETKTKSSASVVDDFLSDI